MVGLDVTQLHPPKFTIAPEKSWLFKMTTSFWGWILFRGKLAVKLPGSSLKKKRSHNWGYNLISRVPSSQPDPHKRQISMIKLCKNVPSRTEWPPVLVFLIHRREWQIFEHLAMYPAGLYPCLQICHADKHTKLHHLIEDILWKKHWHMFILHQLIWQISRFF